MTAEHDGETVYARVQASFGPHAANYTTSAGHADRDALARLVARIAPRPTDRVLDIGTGAGHMALAFAPIAATVAALDVTRPMLDEVRRNALARDIGNVTVYQGAAECLPFVDGSFDIVSCRLTTHHFADLPRAVSEIARVLATGGRLVVSDTMVPEDDDLDHAINEMETIRDPSHVRNWRPSEWRHMLAAARLRVVECDLGYYDEGDGMDFDAWTSRIGTPPDRVTALRARFTDALPALVAALRIEQRPDGLRFALPRLTIIAAK